MNNQTNADLGPNAVIYLRAAARYPGDIDAIIPQHDACTATAARLGATTERVFLDQGSAGSARNRPGLKQLLGYVAKHQPHYVITYDAARLSCSPSGMNTLEGRLNQAGSQLVFANPSQREAGLSAAHQQFLHDMLKLVATYQSRVHSEEVKRGIARSRARKAAVEAQPKEPPLQRDDGATS